MLTQCVGDLLTHSGGTGASGSFFLCPFPRHGLVCLGELCVIFFFFWFPCSSLLCFSLLFFSVLFRFGFLLYFAPFDFVLG